MAGDRKRIRLKIRIDSDPTRIYDAMTNPLKLSIWLCDKAEVAVKLRGTVRLTGSHCVAYTFPEKEIKGTITELEPNRLMKFNWPISGKNSEVTFQIDDRGRFCEFLVTHEKIPDKSALMDAWIIYLYNLQSLLKYQRPAYRMDYGRIDTGSIKREVFIEALPGVVFKALTDEQELQVWFAKDAVSEPQVDGKYSTGWKDKNGKLHGPTTIKEIVENKKLVYDWVDETDGKVGDLVTWELVRIGERTRVNFKHWGFDPARYNKDYMQGWHAFILTLKDYCESGGRISYTVIDGDWSC
jgi:uncharacterized protein YndB with AHSA1/START domain